MGLVVERVGTSSVVYRILLFQGEVDEAAAEGRFVHVYIARDRVAGQPEVRAIPDAIRRAALELLEPPV